MRETTSPARMAPVPAAASNKANWAAVRTEVRIHPAHVPATFRGPE
jgi:hypothetical protein